MQKKSISKYLWVLLGIVLSGLTLYLALRRVSIWQVSREIRQANATLIALAVVSVLINTLMKGIRWYRLTGEVGRRVGFSQVLATNIVGQLLNLIYPARAGDVSRVLIIGRGEREKANILASVVLEKLTDLVAYVILVIVFLTLHPLPGWLGMSVYITIAIAVAGMIFVGWWVSNPQRGEKFGQWLENKKVRLLPERIWIRLSELMLMSITALGMIRHRKQAIELGIWTGLIWLTALLNNLLVWYAHKMDSGHPDQMIPGVMLLLIGLMVIILLPSVPGRFGVFEYTCILVLSVFGFSEGQALTYGITLHAVVFLPGLILGGAALLWLSWKLARQVDP